ncbi:MAG: OmpH family outer membrane protein [Burkholderiales bacterium]|nr:OmpH family outer membrane protein [Burkholderiales bacterium]
MKKLHTLALLPLFALAAGAAHAQGKIGFVNLDRILRDAAPAVRAQKKIEAEFSKRDQELQKQAQQLKQMQENLERNGVTLAESERQRREREFAESTRDFQRRQREFREDLNQRRNEELAGVLERANRAVRQIAEQEQYDIIFQEAVYASPRIDITEKVIKALDDTKPAGK